MTYSRNPLHPKALYLSGRAWTRLLQGHAPDPPADLLRGVDRLRAVVPQGSAAPDGWQRIRRTTLCSVPVTQALAAALAAAQQRPVEIEIRALSRTDPHWSEWIRLHWQVYQKNHQDNPPRPLVASEQDDLFGHDLLEAGALACFSENELTGFASLRQSDKPDCADIGWLGLRPGADCDQLDALVYRLLVLAQDRGLSTLECEADDDDPAATYVLGTLVKTSEQAFETWQRDILSGLFG